MSSVLLQALDARVRVTAPEPLHALFADLFADLAVPDDRSDARDIVWSDADRELWHVSLSGGSAIDDAADGLAESIVSINRLAASSVAATHTVLHAGAFEVNGSAVAVTGASGAGKSTLVAAALLRGHGYLADEVCAVDPANYVVRPYHRPLGLRAHGAASIGVGIPANLLDAFGQVYPLRASHNGRLAGATKLRLLAFLHRRTGPVEITTVRPADALAQLTSLSLGTDGVERSMFRRLDSLVRDIHIVTVGYADSFAAVDALAEMVR